MLSFPIASAGGHGLVDGRQHSWTAWSDGYRASLSRCCGCPRWAPERGWTPLRAIDRGPSQGCNEVCTVRRLNLAPPQQMYDRLVAGGIAGAVSRTLVAPLERYC